MRMNDLAARTGVNRKTIHHYIQKGLLSPTAEENGYYRFSVKDEQRLQLICRLRLLDLSLDEIGEILSNGETAKYYLMRRLKDLSSQSHEIEWQLEQLRRMVGTGLLERMQEPEELLYVLPEEKPAAAPRLDENDAAMLCTYFWGTFMKGQEMTEYRRYLWDRMVHDLVARQDPDLLKLRDYLFRLTPADIDLLFLNQDQRIRFFAELREEDRPQVCRDMIEKVGKRLDDPQFVRYWNSIFDPLVVPAVRFYSGAAYELMREFSEQVDRYKRNIYHCTEQFRSYLATEEGARLARKLQTALGGRLDPDDSGLLSTLYMFC